MATTKPWRVGSIRERLADLLNEALAEPLVELGHAFHPSNLRSNFAHHTSQGWCSWDGWSSGACPLRLHVSSWDSMRECARRGIVVNQDDSDKFWYEVSAKD